MANADPIERLRAQEVRNPALAIAARPAKIPSTIKVADRKKEVRWRGDLCKTWAEPRERWLRQRGPLGVARRAPPAV